MFALLSQRRLGWISYVSRMEAGRIPKDILYGELLLELDVQTFQRCSL